MDKALGLLGIAKKAGLLAIGSQATSIAVRQGKARLIITALDASEGSVRRAAANAETGKLEHIAVPYTKFEIGSMTGRGSPGVVAILDKGLAEGFKKKMTGATATEQTVARAAKESDA